MKITSIHLSDKLDQDYKEFLKQEVGIDCANVCFKIGTGTDLSEDAKIALVGFKVWSQKNAELALQHLKIKQLQEELARLKTPNCFWDEGNPDGETFHTVKELAETLDRTQAVHVVEVGRSTQLDSVYMVVDHDDKSFTLVSNQKEADWVKAEREKSKLHQGAPQGLELVKGVTRKPKHRKRRKSKEVTGNGS